jgi:hypothetical protein
MSVFNTTEKICLLITNLVFWAVVSAVVVDSQFAEDVSLFFGSIYVSTIFLILQEVKNGYKNLYR